MSNVLGNELLRIQQATERREGEAVVRSAMRSQYLPGDKRAVAIRAGVIDVIDNPSLAGYSMALSGFPGEDEINRTLSRNPTVRRAVDMLPPPFTTSQKTRIKMKPLSFLEEYVQANKNLVVAIVRRARSKLNYVKNVSIADMVTRKRHTYKVQVTESSDWKDVLVAAIAMSNRYPAQMAMATGETVANMTQAGLTNVFANVVDMFSGYTDGALGDPATATGAAGTAATITAVTGLIAAIAAAAGTILPIIVGMTTAGTGAPVTQAEIDSRPPAKKERTARAPSVQSTPPVPVVAKQSSGISPLMILGGVAALGGVALLMKRK